MANWAAHRKLSVFDFTLFSPVFVLFSICRIGFFFFLNATFSFSWCESHIKGQCCWEAPSLQKPLNGMLLEPTSQHGRQWLIATVSTVATLKKKNPPPAAEKGVSEVKIRNVCRNPGPRNVLGQFCALRLCLMESKKKFLLYIIKTCTFNQVTYTEDNYTFI